MKCWLQERQEQPSFASSWCNIRKKSIHFVKNALYVVYIAHSKPVRPLTNINLLSNIMIREWSRHST